MSKIVITIDEPFQICANQQMINELCKGFDNKRGWKEKEQDCHHGIPAEGNEGLYGIAES